MANYRCFIAVDFNQQILAEIANIQNSINKTVYQSIRWVKANNLHLTIKFFGDTASENIPKIANSMDCISSTMIPFPLRLSGMGVFPGWKNPRILWLGIEKPEKVQFLAEEIEGDMGKLGIAREKRPFSPHLTIARINDNFPYQKIELLKIRCNEEKFNFPDNVVSKINLYRSDLQPHGPIYHLLHTSLFCNLK